MRILVCIPTYNERDNLESLLPEVLAACSADILIVDDASPDGTGAFVDEWASREPRLHVVHRAGKLGLGTAHREAFRYALDHGYDLHLAMDADHSHDPRSLPALIEAARDADLVIGSRYTRGGSTPGWPWKRRFLSVAANTWTRWMLGRGVRDYTGGFRAFRADTLRRLRLDHMSATGYGLWLECTATCLHAGLSVREVPIAFHDRRHGVSKLNGGIARESFVLVWKLFFRRLLGRPLVAGILEEPLARHSRN